MSKGARFIWNTEYFHIAKPGEAYSKYAKSPTAAMNLVEYCATREGVALRLDEKYWYDPPTQKQLDLIRDLEEAIGENNKERYQDSFEYRDYIESPNKGNASEYITFLSERLRFAGSASSEYTANLIEYAAKRPGVQKFHSEHGLFSSEEVDLEEAKEHVATHEGNIWTHVLSLRREDAQMLGYESAEPWRELVMSKLDILAEAHNIKLENLEWYAAMHNESHHPHIHLFIMSKDPNEGFFSEEKFQSISRCKSEFANTIFAEEMYNEYTLKEEAFQELKTELRYELKSLLDNPLSSYSEESQQLIVNKMIELSKYLQYSKTRKYGFLKPALKGRVNEILHHIISNSEHLSALYQKWCEHQFSIERIYLNNPNEIPIEEQGEKFNLFRNMIIRQCADLNNIDNNDIDFDFDSEPNYKYIPEDLNFESAKYAAENIETRTGEDCYNLANCYYYGIGTDVDYETALMWYGIASEQYHHDFATLKVAELYGDPSHSDIYDKDLSDEFYKRAYYELKSGSRIWEAIDQVESGKENIKYYAEVSKSDAYREYLIGKLYLEGNGVEQDIDKAILCLRISSEHGDKDASLELGKIYSEGKHIESDNMIAKEYLEKAVEQNSSVAAYYMYKNIDSNIEPEIKTKHLETAADLHHPYASFLLAKQLEKSNIDKSISLYEFAAKNNIVGAEYRLGKLLGNPEDEIHYRPQESYQHYQTALDKYISDESFTNSAFLTFRVAYMYHKGLGTEVDLDKAMRLYLRSFELGNKEVDLNYQEAQAQHSQAAMSLATTAAHIGNMIQNDVNNIAQSRLYHADSKILRQEKKLKMESGQAYDDYSQY